MPCSCHSELKPYLSAEHLPIPVKFHKLLRLFFKIAEDFNTFDTNMSLRFHPNFYPYRTNNI